MSSNVRNPFVTSPLRLSTHAPAQLYESTARRKADPTSYGEVFFGLERIVVFTFAWSL
jgi:hypothetical protein